MPIAITPQPAAKITSEFTGDVVLSNISWQTYQAMLTDIGDRSSLRLIYDREELEIKMPSDFHEAINRLLARIVGILAEELDLPLKEFGSVTLNRSDIKKGAEPDSSFYIQNADRIIGNRIDISIDPPPDLIIEVDITNSSTRSFAVYQQLGISEIWRYTNSGVTIFQLQDGNYIEREFSNIFPMISGDVLGHFLQMSATENTIAIVRAVRKWLTEILSP
jgi:Uma2 family endonuclease